jgi:hypothetical protein
MKNLLCIYLSVALAVLTAPTMAFAQDPPSPTEECKLAVPVTSPCTGVLLPSEAAANGIRCLKVDLPKLKLDLSFNQRLMTQEKAHFSALLELERNRNEQLSQQVNLLLKTDRSPKWYNSPYLWAGVGLLVGAGMAIGMAHALPDR